ncbi:MAG TPA: cupin domain-containing protein [Victivallales bacterium]|nr:cupin domain-containing protein [Victivallales bacterium]
MHKINNIDNIADEFIDPDFESDLQTKLLGKLAGTKKLNINIDLVKPGAKSTKYHSHSTMEEFFIILKGTGKLRLNNKEYEIKQGDFLSKPAGENIAHQFINDSKAVLEILDIGTKDESDIVTYPDEGTVLIKNLNKAFNIRSELKDWKSEPD